MQFFIVLYVNIIYGFEYVKYMNSLIHMEFWPGNDNISNDYNMIVLLNIVSYESYDGINHIFLIFNHLLIR